MESQEKERGLMDPQIIRSYFLQYLNICNMALNRHKDDFPYKQMLEIGESALGGKNIGIAVLADDSNLVTAYFTVRLSRTTFDVVAHQKEEAEMDWTVKESYVKKVVESPGDYIAHPEKLEWEWLKSRLNIGKK